METNYIYLLQEREFLKSKEDVFKVGMTTKHNHERFNQYPKGSILLFQMICDNCKLMEKQIITSFKEKFTQRKDIGTEYFQGSYKSMIEIIYLTIKNELCVEKKDVSDEDVSETNDVSDEDASDDDVSEDNEDNAYEEETPYTITTYDEWIKENKISKIIVTKKNGKGEGYLRFKGQLWLKFYDETRFDFNNDMEHLMGFLENNKPHCWKMVMPENRLVPWSEMMDMTYEYEDKITGKIINWNAYNFVISKDEKENYIELPKKEAYKFVSVECDLDKIHQDILKKCYKRKNDEIKLQYHEYVFSKCGNSSVKYFKFDSLTFTFTPIDEVIDNKILTNADAGQWSLYIKDIVDINIVDEILNSLINNETKCLYKKLVYNLLVERVDQQIIFYDDYNGSLLTTWIRDMLYCIKGRTAYVNSQDFYENKIEFKKLIKKNKPRLVIIKPINKISIETQIADMSNLGFTNIIVQQKGIRNNNMYNIVNFRKYLQDNKTELINLIKKENKYNINIKTWKNEIKHKNSIFYRQHLLLTNYLKWCCVKSGDYGDN